jgi:hypothetical protein
MKTGRIDYNKMLLELPGIKVNNRGGEKKNRNIVHVN